METIRLRNTTLEVSRLCMGGCPMGEYGWGNVSREEVLRAVRQALDQGVNFFDTADTYGLGRSEETLGLALAGRRDQAVIATKFGVRVENGHTFWDNSPAWMERAVTDSLRRLRTEVIDLYQVHYLDGHTPLEQVVEGLERLRERGYIRAYGLSNLTEDTLAAAMPFAGRFASCQQHYSLAHRDDEALLRALGERLQATPMTWGSLGQGVLTGKYGADAAFGPEDRRSRAIYENFHGPKLLRNLEIVKALSAIASDKKEPVAAVAIRFIMDALPGSVVLTGVKTPEQAAQNARALTFSLSQEELARLAAASAPTAG